MVGNRRPLLLVLGLLLLAPLAHGAPATVSATAVISGSGTTYRLTVRNTGCWTACSRRSRRARPVS
jgi:hypothetical protein